MITAVIFCDSITSMKRPKKAHFIGICGAGMSAVALLLKEDGWIVSGSDEGFYPPTSDFLTAHNLPCTTPYSPDNIPHHVNRIIIGKNAKLTPDSNAEVAAAFKRVSENNDHLVVSFPDVLEELTAHTQNIVVAGSYGKSTCAAILAHVLVSADKDPSYFIGAIPYGMPPAHRGGGDVFVIEGDEYPSSNWDTTSKFLHYNATDVLLTSATHDHINVFPTLKEYHAPFKTLLENIPNEGLLVASQDEPHAASLFNSFKGKRVSYGLNTKADYTASNIVYGEETSFDLLKQGEHMVRLTTSLLGAHNVENIVGCSALLLERNLVTPEELKNGVESFHGIVRRLDKKSNNTRIPVYEGFGSSQEKAHSAIAAMKLHFPHRNLIIIFEPHTFTWRNKGALGHYTHTFRDSVLMLVYEPATQGADTHEQLTHAEIVDYLNTHGTTARAIHSKEDGIELLKKHVTEDSSILLLTSGDLGGLIDASVAYVEKTFPN